MNEKQLQRLPYWLKKQTSKNQYQRKIRKKLPENINTVCESAKCPNRGECFSKGTVTFMILGNICTRFCSFCAIEKNIDKKPLPIDSKEPFEVAKAVAALDLNHVVVTSVTRDDLPDGGATHFAKTIDAIRDNFPTTSIEVLVPDFIGNKFSLDIVLKEKPAVFNHNLETVPSLYKKVRPQADYRRSLEVLSYAKNFLLNHGYTSTLLKSGIMVGLGETISEIKATLHDLKTVGIDIVTIGQYIAPSKKHLQVVEYIKPEQFDKYTEIGKEIGVPFVFAGPLVRSSYHAEEIKKRGGLI